MLLTSQGHVDLVRRKWRGSRSRGNKRVGGAELVDSTAGWGHELSKGHRLHPQKAHMSRH